MHEPTADTSHRNHVLSGTGRVGGRSVLERFTEIQTAVIG